MGNTVCAKKAAIPASGVIDAPLLPLVPATYEVNVRAANAYVVRVLRVVNEVNRGR